MAMPRAHRYEDQFAAAVAEVAKALPPEVVRVRYEFREDWVGEPSVFFKILMVDGAFKRGKMALLSREISRVFDQKLEPEEEWGIHAYFEYRSTSTQERMQEPAWA